MREDQASRSLNELTDFNSAKEQPQVWHKDQFILIDFQRSALCMKSIFLSSKGW